MRRIAIDFETYYDTASGYTLRRMTTEEYIRDPRFLVLLCSFRVDGAAPYYRAGADAVATEFQRLGPGNTYVAHHAHFDGLICSHVFGVVPGLWLDSLSMARALLPGMSHSLGHLAEHLGVGAKTIDYQSFDGVRELTPELSASLGGGSCRDALLCDRITDLLLPRMPAEELLVIDHTVRMFTEPALQLDTVLAADELAAVRRRKEATLAALGLSRVADKAGKPKCAELQSAEKFAALLRQLDVEPPTKPNPKGEVIYAFAKTDEAMTELLNHDDERVQMLAAARLGEKSTITETRLERLLGSSARGTLGYGRDPGHRGPIPADVGGLHVGMPVYLNYCGAHTTRWSGGDKMNWQNFPRGSAMRKSILPPPGHKLLILDLSQIEARLLRWFAGQYDRLALFVSGDPYCEFASRVFGETVVKGRSELDGQRRQVGKVNELQLGYASGAETLQRAIRVQAGLTLPLEQCVQMVRTWRATNPAVTALWREADQVTQWMHDINDDCTYPWRGCLRVGRQHLVLPNGMALHYPQLHGDKNGEWRYMKRRAMAKLYGGKLVENFIQALSRVILSQAMVRIFRVTRMRAALCTHDELVYVAADNGRLPALYDVLAMLLAVTPDWAAGLPLAVEGHIADRYDK